MKTLRIFISSPGDVRPERVRAFDVVNRLQTRFSAFLKLEAILWEHDAQSGWSTFQANIIPPSKTDIVVCILWARIGMRLPENYQRPDGSVPTGTEWEFEDAYAGFKLNGTPDLYVYRKTATPTIQVTSEEQLEEWRLQKKALDLFFERWFRDHGSAFKAGFNSFESDEQFEKMLEQHLERLINKKILEGDPARGEETQAITWFEGSPFRGLSAFQPEHAPIFFGRELARREITDRLVAQSAGGRVFLMILGSSGCGKSSLVRAGVIPALQRPGLVPGIDCWRSVIVRPGEVSGTLLEGFAQSLFGQGALPELARLGYTPASFAGLLNEAPAHAIPSLEAALQRVAESVASEKLLSRGSRCRLIVVIDQLEEIFTLERCTAEERQRLFRAIAAFSRSGLAWVICTMRSDLYARCAEVEEIISLKGQEGQYDLSPPGIAEIGQMIRLPAKAAGLRFEQNPDTGKGLDDALHEEASKNPGGLPLLEFTLDELYRLKSEQNLLTWKAYQLLGGMQGAIARRAEQIYERISPQAKSILPEFFSSLIVFSDRETPTAKSAPVNTLKSRPGGEELVENYTQANLFVADLDARGIPVISFAHEALLSCWPRLQTWLEENREFLTVRDRISAAAIRWGQEQKSAVYLLAEGKPLVEGMDLRNRRPELLTGQESEFVEASVIELQRRQSRETRRRRNVLMAVSSALAIALILAVISFFLFRKAERSAMAANEARNRAEELVNYMLFDLRDKLQAVGRLNVLDDVVKKVRQYQEKVPGDTENDNERRQREVALFNQGEILFDRGQLGEALDTYLAAKRIAEALYARDPNNPQRGGDLAIADNRIGDVLKSQGKMDEPLRLFQSNLSSFQTLSRKNPTENSWKVDMAETQERIGDVLLKQGKNADSLDAYEESRKIRQSLVDQDSSDASSQSALAKSYDRIALVLIAQGKLQEALNASNTSLTIVRGLAERDPSNARWQGQLASTYWAASDILVKKRDTALALQALEQSLTINRKLVAQDSTNLLWLKEEANSLNSIGDLRHLENNPTGALAAYQELIEIRRKLVAQDSTNGDWQRELATSLNNVADILKTLGRVQEGSIALQASNEITKALTEKYPSNTRWLSDLAIGQSNLGDFLTYERKFDQALVAYHEHLRIFKELNRRDEKNTEWQAGLAMANEKIGFFYFERGNVQSALDAYEQCLEIRQRLALWDPGNFEWKRDLSYTYNYMGELHRAAGRLNEALSAHWQELALDEDRRKAHPDDVEAASDLAAAEYNIGLCLGAMRDQQSRHQAKERFAMALQLLRQLAAKTTLNAFQQGLMRNSADALAKLK
jgi:eukaryotic-like serine/threonine-protein kinase